MLRNLILAAAAIVMIGLTAVPATADTLTWRIRKNTRGTIYLEFYSQDYNRAWPGRGKSYVLRDRRLRTYRLRCRRGERICYGAWTRGERRYWGVGRYGDNYCRNCCYRCGQGKTRRITLTR